MSDNSEEYEASIPSGKRAQLEQSIHNLVEWHGRTDSMLFGLLVNLGLALVGVIVYLYADGVVAYAGAVWSLVNLFGIIKWVFNL